MRDTLEPETGERSPGLTYLAFDYGLRRIGVAVGQTVTGTATDLDTLESVGSQPDWDSLDQLIDTWRPEALIVGLPLNSQGAETDMSRSAREFGKNLATRHGLEVYWVNEHLTSVSARDWQPHPAQFKRSLGCTPTRRPTSARQKSKARKNVDRVAARLILQSFLNENAAQKSKASP